MHSFSSFVLIAFSKFSLLASFDESHPANNNRVGSLAAAACHGLKLPL